MHFRRAEIIRLIACGLGLLVILHGGMASAAEESATRMTLDEFIALSQEEKAALSGSSVRHDGPEESAGEGIEISEPEAELVSNQEPAEINPEPVKTNPEPAEAPTDPSFRINVESQTENIVQASGENSQSRRIPINRTAIGELKLDIFTAVRMAVESHPSVSESIGRLYQQTERVSVAKAGYFPTVSSGISTGYRDSLGRSEEAFNLSVSQMVYDFGKVGNSVDIEEYGVQRDQAGVLLSIDDLARETALAFIEVQRYQRLVELADEQIESIGELQQMAEQRAQLGASTRSDEMQAQSREEAARATRLQLQAELDAWKRALQNLVSMDRPLQITDGFPERMSNACEIAAEDYSNAPEVLMAEAELEEARARIDKAKSDFFPTVSLNLDYDNYFDESNNLSAPGIDEDVAVSLSVNMDIFQGGAIRARRRASEYALQAASAARERARLSISRRLLEAKDQTSSLSSRSLFLDNRLQNILETQELYRQQYLALGTRTLLDILNTEQEIYQSRFDQENTNRDLQRLQIDCMHSVASIRDAFGLSDDMVQGVAIRP